MYVALDVSVISPTVSLSSVSRTLTTQHKDHLFYLLPSIPSFFPQRPRPKTRRPTSRVRQTCRYVSDVRVVRTRLIPSFPCSTSTFSPSSVSTFFSSSSSSSSSFASSAACLPAGSRASRSPGASNCQFATVFAESRLSVCTGVMPWRRAV